MTLRLNAAYGRTMSVVGPPCFWFASVIVMFGFSVRREACTLLSMRYLPVLLSSVRFRAFSNAWQTETGNQSSGTDESMNANSGVDIKVVCPVLDVNFIARRVTTISLKLSPVIVNMTLLGVNLEAS